ncbi:hypothetical protein GCM10010193_07720 [Kitasatospora atroaurantiaca]|uniref:Resolvase-like protein n=1 Tax=Kitasatospora atroaurantiaca TaxID=285545 RepID=A0A561EJI1_9ACTN|nr:recombinase family protein [Kitasatospora atroaurantiaca]TWE15732.1 resolvase-like protein [Kitasatospora atroaurantiaca]
MSRLPRQGDTLVVPSLDRYGRSLKHLVNMVGELRGRKIGFSSLPQHVDEWSADLRSVHGCVRSTLRNYQGSVRQFCDVLTNPAYGWAEECLRLFGTHPVQVVHDWNAAVHADEAEGEPERRASFCARMWSASVSSWTGWPRHRGCGLLEEQQSALVGVLDEARVEAMARMRGRGCGGSVRSAGPARAVRRLLAERQAGGGPRVCRNAPSGRPTATG